MDLAEQIKNIRNRKGITQVDMAERLGINQSNYGYLEKRGDKLTIEQLTKIAEALGVGVGELLGLGAPIEVANPNTEAIEKRVAELEDRLQDKEYIVANLKETMGVVSKAALNAIDNIEYIIAKKLNIGRIKCYKILTGKGLTEVFSHTISWDEEKEITSNFSKHMRGEKIDFKYTFSSLSSNVINESGQRFYKKGFEFTEQEQQQMVEAMFATDMEYSGLVRDVLHPIYELNASDKLPDYIVKAYQQYFNYTPHRVSF